MTTEPSGCRRGTRVLLYLLGFSRARARAGWCFHTHRRNKRRAPSHVEAFPFLRFGGKPPKTTVGLTFSRARACDARYSRITNTTNKQMIGARCTIYQRYSAYLVGPAAKRKSVVIDGNDKISSHTVRKTVGAKFFVFTTRKEREAASRIQRYKRI